MYNLRAYLKYRKDGNEYDTTCHIHYPENKGIYKEESYYILEEYIQVVNTIKEIYKEFEFGVVPRTTLYAGNIIFYKLDIYLLNENKVNRFIRKNKITKLLLLTAE